MPDAEITKQTTLQGTTNARRILSMKNGCPTNLVRMTMKTREDAEKAIRNGITINGKHHVKEAPHQAPRISRCFNCQEIASHVSNRCPNKPRCPDCAGDHAPTKDCQEPKKCANCGGLHPAYYKNCPAWMNRVRDARSYNRARTAPAPAPTPASPKRDQIVNDRIMERMTAMETEMNKLKQTTATKEELRFATNSLDIKIDAAEDRVMTAISDKFDTAISTMTASMTASLAEMMAAGLATNMDRLKKEILSDIRPLSPPTQDLLLTDVAPPSDDDEDLSYSAISLRPPTARPATPKRNRSPRSTPSPKQAKKGKH